MNASTLRITAVGPDSYTPASKILRNAAELVGNDRAKTHGDTLRNHSNIALGWGAYLRAKCDSAGSETIEITAEDVTNMMEILKVMRRLTGAYNPDDYIDGAGYAANSGEIAERTR